MTFGFYFVDHPALGTNKLGFFQVYCFLVLCSEFEFLGNFFQREVLAG